MEVYFMPTIRIETIPLTEKERTDLAARVYEIMRDHVGDRVIDVYIGEYTLFQRKGVTQEEPSALVELVAALILPKDDMAELTRALYEGIRDALRRPDMNVTFSYVRRDQDHLAVNGELLSDLYRRLAGK